MKFLQKLPWCLLTIVMMSALMHSPKILAEFSDVPGGHPYRTAISYGEANGFILGYPDNTYRPDNEINRAEFTKIIIEAEFPAEEIDTCIEKNINAEWDYVFFPDVPKQSWFASVVCLAKQKGIISGYQDNTYRPEQNISFVEAAKILKVLTTNTTPSSPTSSSTPWYKSSVDYLGKRNAIPLAITAFDQLMSRGDIAEILYRVNAPVFLKKSQNYASLQGEKNSSSSFWNLYRNEAYGYELQYPALYHLAEEKERSTLFSTQTGESSFRITVHNTPFDFSSLPATQQSLSLGNNVANIYKTAEEFCLNTICLDPGIHLITPEAEKQYVLSFSGISEINAEQHQILESFHFSDAFITEGQNCTQDCTSSLDVTEVFLTAKSWAFEPNTIVAQKGETIRLFITSIDVLHGFALPAYNINENLSPSKTVVIEFVADQTGEFTFFCSVFCGAGHSTMKGTLIVNDQF